MAKISQMAQEFGPKTAYCWIVYSLIKRHKSHKTSKTKITAARLVDESGMSFNTLYNSLDLLEEYGYIKRTKSNGCVANIYEILK